MRQSRSCPFALRSVRLPPVREPYLPRRFAKTSANCNTAAMTSEIIHPDSGIMWGRDGFR
jgi:hypothetical protein